MQAGQDVFGAAPFRKVGQGFGAANGAAEPPAAAAAKRGADRRELEEGVAEEFQKRGPSCGEEAQTGRYPCRKRGTPGLSKGIR